jgi:hypothetical protein
MLPLLPVKLESSEVGTLGMVVNHTVHVSKLDSFLHSKPRTVVKQTKHSMDHLKNYECHICACGCSCCLNLIHDVTKNTKPC